MAIQSAPGKADFWPVVSQAGQLGNTYPGASDFISPIPSLPFGDYVNSGPSFKGT